MIKIIAPVANRPTLIMGLDQNNVDAMHLGSDMPLMIDVAALLAGTPNVDKIDQIVLVSGDTLEDVYYYLRKGGMPLPEQMPGYLDE